MSLTQREKVILELQIKNLSDYKIARKLGTDPPSITRSRLNAHKKLKQAQENLQYSKKIGITITES
jgi:DNA-binding CsgD family transcriptional regulator